MVTVVQRFHMTENRIINELLDAHITVFIISQIAVMAAKTLSMLSQTEEKLLVEVEVDESACVIRVGDRRLNKTFTNQSQV